MGDESTLNMSAGPERPLDFLIIGTQKGGTTSLWRYLFDHPMVVMPERKEEPFFCTPHGGEPDAFAAYMEGHFGDAPDEALLGKATPHYMMGLDGIDVETIAQRIGRLLPDVRLIALLRDPIERALSHYRMSRRRELESRSFDEAVEDLLQLEQLSTARLQPTETNTYLVQGEYGRILKTYRSHCPARQLHVEFSEELDRDPESVLDRVLGFLGLPGGYRPPQLGTHYHRGGSRRLLDSYSESMLFEFMREQVWPRLGSESARVERLFAAFYEIWNVLPDDEPVSMAASTRARLEAHYGADARVLAQLHVSAPWLNRWGS